jgi:hypothetical protein
MKYAVREEGCQTNPLPKTEIGMVRQAEKDLVDRTGGGYTGCIAKHNL